MIYYDKNVNSVIPGELLECSTRGGSPDCPVVLQCIGLYGALERCRVVNVHRAEGTACGRVKLFGGNLRYYPGTS